MSTVAEIQEAIEKLPAREKAALSVWMQSQEEPLMTVEEERALLASLDRAAHELDSGKGVPVEVQNFCRNFQNWAGLSENDATCGDCCANLTLSTTV